MLLAPAKERQSYAIGKARADVPLAEAEVVAYCPVCKAFQTLWFTGGRLIQTRKFSQYGEQVYHDCGSNKPCHLYRT